MKTLDEYIEERRARDPEFRQEYDDLGPEFLLRRSLIEARLAKGLTQSELAKQLGTTQSVVARMERGRYRPRVDTLHRLARILGVEFCITGDAPLMVHRDERRRPAVPEPPRTG